MENIKSKILIVAISLLSILSIISLCISFSLYIILRDTGCDCDDSNPKQHVETAMEVNKDTFVGKPNKIIYWNRRREFNDINDTHLAAAQQIGIQPLASREEIPDASRKLHLICANMGFKGPEPYVVDHLTHSTPFLVEDAAELLYEIGVNFQDSLRNKHIPPHCVVVTSVLRTDADVKSLSKRNVNASERSVHCYGTTFDISYKRFLKLDADAPDAREAELVAVLTEVLRDMKKNGRCYVKHEVKQACFHITARKR